MLITAIHTLLPSHLEGNLEHLDLNHYCRLNDQNFPQNEGRKFPN